MAFEIEFYSSEDGREPVAEFLDSLDSKMSAKLVGLMEILEEKGTELRMPYSEHIEDGIFELRCKQGSNITKDICEMCEINRNTFYYYFSDIYQVLEALLNSETDKSLKEETGQGTFYEEYLKKYHLVLDWVYVWMD